jgi:PPE-repeat protein
MDFYLLPPEINSARIVAGPGAAPMFAASLAWRGIAEQLRSAAASHRATIRTLIDVAWQGPSSTAMAAAAASQVLWMDATATGAEQTATAAASAAAAYQTALTESVRPEAITANRTRLAALVASNLLGQNAPAIAATNIEYEQMWAQDIVAMSSYAQTSLATTQLTPFQTPRDGGDPSKLADRAVNNAKDTDPQKHPIWWLMNTNFVGAVIGSAAYTPGSTVGPFFGLMGSIASIAGVMQAQGVPALANPLSGVPALSGLGRLGGVAAGLGQAGRLGRISVPPSWANAAEVTRPLASALGKTPLVSPGSMTAAGLPPAPLSGLGGHGCKSCSAPKYGFRSLVMARPLDADSDDWQALPNATAGTSQPGFADWQGSSSGHSRLHRADAQRA